VLENFWPRLLQIELRWEWLFINEMPALLQLVESNLAAEAAMWSGSSIAALPGCRVIGFHQTGDRSERCTCGSHDGYQHIVAVDVVHNLSLLNWVVQIRSSDYIEVLADT
jgi:hypothetical protein